VDRPSGGDVKGPEPRDKRLTVRIPAALLARLRVVALADGRSLADWALRAIEQEIELAELSIKKRR
jgi:predicted HicB family RNase H-like nuclease